MKNSGMKNSLDWQTESFVLRFAWMKKFILLFCLLAAVHAFAYSQYDFRLNDYEETDSDGNTIFHSWLEISRGNESWILTFPNLSEYFGDDWISLYEPLFTETENGFIMHFGWGTRGCWSFFDDYVFEEIGSEPRLVKILTSYYDEEFFLEVWKKERKINPPVSLVELTAGKILMYIEQEKEDK